MGLEVLRHTTNQPAHFPLTLKITPAIKSWMCGHSRQMQCAQCYSACKMLYTFKLL